MCTEWYHHPILYPKIVNTITPSVRVPPILQYTSPSFQSQSSRTIIIVIYKLGYLSVSPQSILAQCETKGVKLEVSSRTLEHLLSVMNVDIEISSQNAGTFNSSFPFMLFSVANSSVYVTFKSLYG